jgi:hypothetical protein
MLRGLIASQISKKVAWLSSEITLPTLDIALGKRSHPKVDLELDAEWVPTAGSKPPERSQPAHHFREARRMLPLISMNDLPKGKPIGGSKNPRGLR